MNLFFDLLNCFDCSCRRSTSRFFARSEQLRLRYRVSCAALLLRKAAAGTDGPPRRPGPSRAGLWLHRCVPCLQRTFVKCPRHIKSALLDCWTPEPVGHVVPRYDRFAISNLNPSEWRRLWQFLKRRSKRGAKQK